MHELEEEGQPHGIVTQPQKEATHPLSPPPPRKQTTQEAIDALTYQVDHMELRLQEMRRNKEVLIRDLEINFDFSLHGHSFNYPPLSWLMPRYTPHNIGNSEN